MNDFSSGLVGLVGLVAFASVAGGCKESPLPAPAVFDAGLGAATVDSVISLVKGAADLGPIGNDAAGFGGKWIATGLGIVGSSGGPLHVESDGIDGPVRISGGEGMFICPSEQAAVVALPGEKLLDDGPDGCIRFGPGAASGNRLLEAVGKPSSGRFFCLEAGGATVDEASFVRTRKDCHVARLRLAEVPQTTANDASIQAVNHVLRVAGERVGKTRAATCELLQQKGAITWWDRDGDASLSGASAPGAGNDGGVARDLGFTLAKDASIEIRDRVTAHLLQVTGPAHVDACVREKVRREDDRTTFYDGTLASNEGSSDLLRDHWIVTALGVLWFSEGTVHLTRATADGGDAGTLVPIAPSAPIPPIDVRVTHGDAYLWTPKVVLAGGSAPDAHGWRHLQAGDKEQLTATSRSMNVAEECARAVSVTDAEDALVAMDSTQVNPTARRTARAACALADVQAAIFGKDPPPWL